MKSIKAKVLVAFSLIISLCVILGAFNIYSSNKSLVYSRGIIERELPLLIQDEKLLYNLAQRTAFARAYILYGDESYKERFLQYTEESQVIQEELLALSDSDKAKGLIEKSVDWRTMIVERVFTQYENEMKNALKKYSKMKWRQSAMK
ncbi:hypothetical protein [Peribacillus sp. NPDC096448]|uniref:CHASE3 domain-containing protein n=1 Tax=Peribacillus sp. NPDC096448 TaxID=3364395 RepID=UPI00382F249C